MIMRWLSCEGGNAHIIGPCPFCYETQDGLMMGTASKNHRGRVTARCIDCNKSMDYYVDAQEEKIWKLEPTEIKGNKSVDRLQ